MPCTSDSQNDQLNKCPSHHSCIRRLGLISKLGFPFLYRYNQHPSIHPFIQNLPLKILAQQSFLEKRELTRWKTCSRLISASRPFKSLTFCTISLIFPLSLLSISLVSPIARSSVSLMPPWGCRAESQPVPPDDEEGVKQILWSPESAALNVKRPAEEPFWETTRWSLSNTSCCNSLAEVGRWKGGEE